MNTFLICVGILFAAGLLRFALVVRLSSGLQLSSNDLWALGILSKISSAVSIAALAGVAYVWVIFYRDIVAAGLTVAG